MTKYPLTCRHCDFEYEKDQPPPEGAKQDDPDGIAPHGILDTEFVNSAVCPNCGKPALNRAGGDLSQMNHSAGSILHGSSLG